MNRPDWFNQVYLGDAAELLAGWSRECVDLLLTDPPYGNATKYGRASRRIIGDENPLIGLRVVSSCYRLLKRNATAYVFCGAHHLGFLEHFFLRYSAFQLREILVWDKRQPGFGSTFRRAHECILVLEKGQPTYNAKVISTVQSFPRTDTSLHPHAKPLPLLERLIEASSKPGDLVLDPFAGSGSTLLAARNLGRNFLGIELDPAYAETARSRLKQAA